MIRDRNEQKDGRTAPPIDDTPDELRSPEQITAAVDQLTAGVASFIADYTAWLSNNPWAIRITQKGA